MNILSIIIILFVVLESLNVIMLYFFPNSNKGNGLGVFNAYKKSKADPEVHALINYLISWVAGTKLIFIALLIVVIIFGDKTTQLFSVIALILSILTFFVRLYPMIRKMDKNNQLTPKGYSKTLGIMIALFEILFLIAILIYFIAK